LASKDKKPATKKAAIDEKITRISAKDTPAAEKKIVKKTKVATVEVTEGTAKRRNPFVATADYFKGAWYELRQVRWPNRKATWSLTLAVMVFTGFFVLLILLLDALFKYLFELILG
jgi:preprotein translocase SecE subunit